MHDSAMKAQATATLGAGCFWCVEAVLEALRGVTSVVPGYMGGDVAFPTYEAVCTGTTKHAEVIQINFDPTVLTYERLLQIFWSTHDPTTLNRQGYDSGTQYRSVVFYHDDQQLQIARKVLTEWAALRWDEDIVTTFEAASQFYPAEDYHHHFYRSNPGHRYCRVVIDPKMIKLRESFGHLLKETLS